MDYERRFCFRNKQYDNKTFSLVDIHSDLFHSILNRILSIDFILVKEEHSKVSV
jgi:hypothetical protein